MKHPRSCSYRIAADTLRDSSQDKAIDGDAINYHESLHPRACSDSPVGAPCICKFVYSDASDELAEGGPLILYTRRRTFHNL